MPSPESAPLRFITTWLIGSLLSVVTELLVFMSPGLQNYPLIVSESSWLIKHLLIGLFVAGVAVLLEWIWSQRAIEVIYDRSRLIFISTLVLASFVYLHAIHIVPSHVQGGLLQIGCQSFGCLMRFLTYPFGLVISAIIISIVWFLYREVSFKLLRVFLVVVAVVVLGLFLGQAAWQSSLSQNIPLQSAMMHTKVLQLASGKPLVILTYQRDPKGSSGLENEQQVIFRNQNDLGIFYSVTPHMTANQWAATCSQYAASSMGLNILGAGVADACYYIGAEVYKQPAMCDASLYAKVCRTDVAVEVQDSAVCKNDPICLSEPLLR